MIIYLHRVLDTLKPYDGTDLDKLRTIPADELVKCKVTRKRNVRHHRKYWALLGIVFHNLPVQLEDKFRTVEDLHVEIKLQAGYRDKYTTLGGTEIWIPRSISFEKMDQTDFEEFYDRAIDIICKYIIPVDRQDLINQVV